MRTIALADGRILVPTRHGYEILTAKQECTCGEEIDLGCARHFPLTAFVAGYSTAGIGIEHETCDHQ
jgi:hypothetical protein